MSIQSLASRSLAASDGKQLHRQVPPHRWSVTRKDLKHLRTLVEKFVAKGWILPTALHKFEISDGIIGPCIHAVNEQLIQPITAKAGGMSWALMLHPDGLPCDLFVTHCWQEGIYEFIDKVRNSWPRRARHAYCCMLSNPQNLDIGNLISSPSASPFARALRASTYMLVVPNRQCSIYSRAWCAYEAFLAYSDSKIIFTASAPVLHLRREISYIVMTIACVLVIAVVVAAQFEVDDLGRLAGIHYHYAPFGGLVATLAIFAQTSSAVIKHSPVTRAIAYTSAVFSAAYLGVAGFIAAVMGARNGLFGNYTSRSVIDAFGGVCLCIGAATLEVDRLWCIRAQQEASQLLTGYTGRLRDAKSSKDEDKETILRELVTSGKENEVDSAIQVLLDSGVSTPSLRTAVAHAGKLKAAGYWSLSMVLVSWFGWAWAPLYGIADMAERHWHFVEMGYCRSANLAFVCIDPGQTSMCASLTNYCRSPLEGPAVPLCLLNLLGGLAWLFSFIALGRDKRGFAAAALIRIVGIGSLPVLCPLLLLFPLEFSSKIVGIGVLAFAFTPVTLILSIMGPGWASRVPLIGPLIVKLLMLRISFECQRPDEAVLPTAEVPPARAVGDQGCKSRDEEQGG
mmetsp:Transcript_55254/g.140420  ORF Transcript_55254/g.140420 Transcript_55254/m.140420 type:complete len:624 (+) Transcript_55254:51-1922(+)